MIIDWPRVLAMCSPTTRATMSVVPPAANGTINVILRSGNAADTGTVATQSIRVAMSGMLLAVVGFVAGVLHFRTGCLTTATSLTRVRLLLRRVAVAAGFITLSIRACAIFAALFALPL